MGWQLMMSCDYCAEEDSACYGSAEFSRTEARESGWLIRRKDGGFWHDELICPDCRADRVHLNGAVNPGDMGDVRGFHKIHPDFQWDGKTPIGEAMSQYLESVSVVSGGTA